MSELNLTDATFEKDVLKSDKPVLVDLWAPWCGPCRALSPVIEELAAEYAGKVVVGKLNTDENPETAGQLRVSAIPTLIFVKGGKVVDQLIGVHPKAEIKARLDALVAA
jgi:thioredoxin 1